MNDPFSFLRFLQSLLHPRILFSLPYSSSQTKKKEKQEKGEMKTDLGDLKSKPDSLSKREKKTIRRRRIKGFQSFYSKALNQSGAKSGELKVDVSSLKLLMLFAVSFITSHVLRAVSMS